jgi:hypothetical protein
MEIQNLARANARVGSLVNPNLDDNFIKPNLDDNFIQPNPYDNESSFNLINLTFTLNYPSSSYYQFHSITEEEQFNQG